MSWYFQTWLNLKCLIHNFFLQQNGNGLKKKKQKTKKFLNDRWIDVQLDILLFEITKRTSNLYIDWELRHRRHHNIIQIHINVLWDWQYSMKYIKYFCIPIEWRNMEIFYEMLSIPQNNVMDLNNVMMMGARPYGLENLMLRFVKLTSRKLIWELGQVLCRSRNGKMEVLNPVIDPILMLILWAKATVNSND